MPPPQSTAPGKKKSDAKPTSSTPNPVPTSVVQKYVTDAAEIIILTNYQEDVHGGSFQEMQ